MNGKIIILSAPSGSGKSTIIKELEKDASLNLGFSVSATCRKPRIGEIEGEHYFFLTPEVFYKKVENGEFVEWEEVYPGHSYGTLESEVNRIISSGKNLVMDLDVKGALNLKKKYSDRALTLFIMPPSKEILAQRLRSRGTDEEEVIKKRLKKAEYEMSFAPEFDSVVLNDRLEIAVEKARQLIKDFIKK